MKPNLSQTRRRSYSAPDVSSRSSLPFGLTFLDPFFLQHYRVIGGLGRGGHGYVMSAIHRQSGLCVAVKLIIKADLAPNSLVKDPVEGGLIPLEIFLLRPLSHPNIIGYREHFQDRMFYYLVVDFHGISWSTPTTIQIQTQIELQIASNPNLRYLSIIPRRKYDLFECIARYKRFPEPIAQHIFSQIVNAVSYLARQGIYHCDIKDENILIDNHFNVKLADFGSACRIPRHTLLKQFHGTITFASPEILMGCRYNPEPAEIWSLGVLLHIILTGGLPFKSADEYIYSLYVPLDTMSPLLADLMISMLHKLPDQRISLEKLQQHPWISSII
ncbi:kinase-like domain-containing protein [Phycomyces blakesleeanus]|uniref:Kinase-like domain-containing protein n=1 Tax=Phycomyces blakesleeanus TaxID=4837 RepID=A0ABR3ARZ6_PHYBL